jgi:hypothetical protein
MQSCSDRFLPRTASGEVMQAAISLTAAAG